MTTFFSAAGRDLIHACRSLAKARAFTFVCVTTLGIGMAPSIAIQFGSRIFTTPPPSVNVERPTKLVELVTTKVGPHRPTSVWSYPDYVDLRDTPTGVAITGWAADQSKVARADASSRQPADTLYVSPNYFTIIGVPLARGSEFTGDTTEAVVIVSDSFW